MRYHRPAPAPVAVAGATGGLGGENPTATLKIQNPRYGLSGFHFVSAKFVTWLVESNPPCGRVTDTSRSCPLSRHQCCKPVSLLSVGRHIRHCYLPPNIFHICSIAISIYFSVQHCSLFCVLPVTAFCYCFLSPRFVIVYHHCFRHCSVQCLVLSSSWLSWMPPCLLPVRYRGFIFFF